ncbi:hypothetical protein [Roseibium sp.]|uniref:hypothetical protein n=1 Tax=Roseibium sp. TaxID=1936156 RepID=UPI003BAC08DD
MMKRSEWYAAFTWGGLTGVAVTLAAAVVLEVPLFWVDSVCGAASLYCFVYTWQGLLSGIIAAAGALLAALRAWRAAMKQIRVTADIPIELRKSELAWEGIRLTQVGQRLDMYYQAASAYLELFAETKRLDTRAFQRTLLSTEPFSRPTASILGSMAETCPLPGLRSELLNTERNVQALNDTAAELDRRCRGVERLTDEDVKRVDEDRTKTKSNARTVIASVEAVKECIEQDQELIKKEIARLDGLRHSD